METNISPTRTPKHRLLRLAVVAVGIVVAAGALVAVTVSKSSSSTKKAVAQPRAVGAGARPSSEARLRTGARVKALDFTVDAAVSPSLAKSNQKVIAPQSSRLPSDKDAGATTPAAAVTSLVRTAIAGDADTAWAFVGTIDQVRLGYKQRITEQVNASGWKSFSVTSADGDSVEGTLTQTPKVSDIDGVIAPTATLRVRTIREGSNYRVLWSRKSIVQNYAEQTDAQDDAVSSAVRAWLRSRQACEAAPANEFSGGLIGVTGLANKLCRSSGSSVIGAVSDLEALDEPQPIIEAFGGSALQWARVASITAPVPMDVVVAPLGSQWIVVAVARPSLTMS